jgi:hypothetical protein
LINFTKPTCDTRALVRNALAKDLDIAAVDQRVGDAFARLRAVGDRLQLSRSCRRGDLGDVVVGK